MQIKSGVARRVLAAAAAIAFLALGAVGARAADVMSEPAPAEVATRVEDGWRFINPFGPCEMNCSAMVAFGKYISTPMSDIFGLQKVTAPWDWKTKDSTILTGSFNREVLVYKDLISFETDFGVGKRFGRQDEWELWAAIFARWKKFPWSDYVRTTVAISTGFNWASDVSRIEIEKSPKNQSEVLHYLSPEITLGLPSQPNLDLVFRFHHRSGGDLGLFNGTGGGSQYQTVGLRYRW